MRYGLQLCSKVRLQETEETSTFELKRNKRYSILFYSILFYLGTFVLTNITMYI